MVDYTSRVKDLAYPTYTSKFPEMGYLAFPGAAWDTRAELEQAKYADQIGMGNVFVAERSDYKEVGALCGAVAGVTENMYINTSATNANTRHPVFLAGMCTTLNRVSMGRFALGLARGNAPLMKAWGLKPNTFATEREYFQLYKRLFKGEVIRDYTGKIGDYPMLALNGEYVNEDIPILFVGFGEKALKNAGSLYDGAHLHTFMAPQAVKRAVGLIREGEKGAGKEVGKAKVWSVLATAVNPSEQTYLKYIVARLATYVCIPSYGEALANINGWDLEEIERFRNQPAVKAIDGYIDAVATLSQLEAIEKVLPQEWRSAAVGTPEECARRWVEDFEAGASGVMIHASRPEEFEPVLAAYEKIRPSHLFEGRTNRPA